MLIVKSKEQTIKEFWASYWDRVDRDPDRISDDSIYPLFPVAKYVKPEWRILEAGCGMGRVFKHYFYQRQEIIGLEYDGGCLKKLRQENPDFLLLHADARAMPLKDETMDLVMGFGLVSSIEQGYQEVLYEMNRVLKPGGMICASVVSHNALRSLQNCLYWLQHFVRTVSLQEGNRSFYARAYRPVEWAHSLERAGFEVLGIEPSHSRVLLWEFLPFLRERGVELDMTLARDGDVGYRLNRVGETLFQKARQWFPWVISVGLVGIAQKKI